MKTETNLSAPSSNARCDARAVLNRDGQTDKKKKKRRPVRAIARRPLLLSTGEWARRTK